MNWLTNLFPPKLKELVKKADIPDDMWHRCDGCGGMLFHKDLAKMLHVCHHCDHHMRISAPTRLKFTFDNGEYEEIGLEAVAVDPLKFKDTKKYADRIKEAHNKTKLQDAIVIGRGQVSGVIAVAVAFDFSYMGGSMGMAVGSGILKAAQIARGEKTPLLLFPSSGGARMQEGILSLMQMPRTVIALQQVKECGQPVINILCHPTTGGVTASFAMLGDITIAEPKAIIGFAGARVIKETISKDLPEGFQTAEYLLDHGMIDMVCHRKNLREKLGHYLHYLTQKPNC